MYVYALMYKDIEMMYPSLIEIFSLPNDAHQHAIDQLSYAIDEVVERDGSCTDIIEEIEETGQLANTESIIRLMSENGTEMEYYSVVKKELL